MHKSSISKLPDRGPNSAFALTLGRAIRTRRHALGLTQSELGRPMTKGFVSEVERGRSLPSLPALSFLADRLQVSVSALLDAVKGVLPRVYTPPVEDEHTQVSPRRR